MSHDLNRRRAAYWDKQAARYDRAMDFWDRHLFGDSRPWACGRAAGDVLEVAVGTGRNLSFYPDGARLTGVDWSPAMLGIAVSTTLSGRAIGCRRRSSRSFKRDGRSRLSMAMWSFQSPRGPCAASPI